MDLIGIGVRPNVLEILIRLQSKVHVDTNDLWTEDVRVRSKVSVKKSFAKFFVILKIFIAYVLWIIANYMIITSNYACAFFLIIIKLHIVRKVHVHVEHCRNFFLHSVSASVLSVKFVL